MSKYTPQFMAEFEASLNNVGRLPPIEVHQENMRVLAVHDISYVQTFHPSQVLCHRKNRGSLMLSPYQAHRNAHTVHRVGADRKQLMNAVALELAADGPQRVANLQANEALVRRSKGLLPEVTGKPTHVVEL